MPVRWHTEITVLRHFSGEVIDPTSRDEKSATTAFSAHRAGFEYGFSKQDSTQRAQFTFVRLLR